jgi:hypothetical protein
MDKGIRPAANTKFLELLPTRVNTREGNTAFRKNVICFIMEQYGATLASAATHYNHAFITAREKAKTDETLAQLLVGLGRPEDKKGGRKPKAQPVATPKAPAKPSVIPQPVNMLLQNMLTSNVVQPAAQITAAAALVGLEDLLQQEEVVAEDAPQVEEAAEETVAEEAVATDTITLYSVYKVAKGTCVAQDLTKEQADELVAKAAAAKKAKLEARAQ